jgi:hypothetical protein
MKRLPGGGGGEGGGRYQIVVEYGYVPFVRGTYRKKQSHEDYKGL